jgi:hypothetical protein
MHVFDTVDQGPMGLNIITARNSNRLAHLLMLTLSWQEMLSRRQCGGNSYSEYRLCFLQRICGACSVPEFFNILTVLLG